MKLGKICTFNQKTYSEKENWNEIYYLDTGNIIEGKVFEVHKFNPEHDKIPSRAKRKVETNDIIYSTVRPNQRHYGIIKKFVSNLLVSTGFVVISINEDLADPYYIYKFLTQDSIILKLQAIAEQSTSAYPSIKPIDIANLDIDLPPLSNQKSIGAILQNIDEKIAINQEINHNLEQQAQAIFNIYIPYGIVDTVPPGWKIGSMGEIIELHDSKRIPLSNTDRMKMKNKTYPYYGAASLVDYVDDYIFDGKFLLLGEDGTIIDAAGYPILQYVWGKFWVNNHAHILTGKLGFNVESLYLLFKQTPVSSIITGAVQPKISQANLQSIPGVIPPRHILDEINDRIEPLFSQIRTNIDQNNLLISLRDTLLPRLMSGEIDVSNIKI